MTIIKKIINWFINLLRSIFKKKNNELTGSLLSNTKKSVVGKKKKAISPISNESLPSYMIISDSEREKLLYNISLMVDLLKETNKKKREDEEEKLIKLIKEKYNIKTIDIIDQKNLESIINRLDQNEKESIINNYHSIIDKEKEFKIHISEVDKVVNLIKDSQISILAENEIEKEIGIISNDKNIDDKTDEKISRFNKNIFDIVKEIDSTVLENIKKEYDVVNYITLSTFIVDKKLDELKKLQEDFKNHRYNRFYYEREIKRLKHDLNQIRNLKNKKDVSDHINKLKSELYTKSKDKYDILYNNEVFMNFNKECDILLDKINAKVIDIKKEKKEEPKEEDNKKNKYLENIIKRFHDMELARRLILLSQEEDLELINDPKTLFVDEIINKYNNGIEKDFNFDRNKKKTELVILFNELNMAIAKETKEPFISIDHINFRMNDLEEAVEVKKKELGNLLNMDLSKKKKSDVKVKSLNYEQPENKR